MNQLGLLFFSMTCIDQSATVKNGLIIINEPTHKER